MSRTRDDRHIYNVLSKSRVGKYGLTENMKSISRSSPAPVPSAVSFSGVGGGVRCRKTILLSPSRYWWYLMLPARVLAEPPGEKTWASSILSAMRALPAAPTNPTATTPSWEVVPAPGPAPGLGLVVGAGEGEGDLDLGGGVRESTRTVGEGVALGGGSIAGGEVEWMLFSRSWLSLDFV